MIVQHVLSKTTRHGRKLNPNSFDANILLGKIRIGLSAGASAPESQVQLVIDYIRQFNDIQLTEIDGIEENITFKLPVF